MLSRVTHTIGRRGAFLLFLALLDFIYAFSLLTPSMEAKATPTLAFLAGVGGLWLWAILWGTVGFICLVTAFLKKDAVGFGAAMFIKILWALLFLMGWLFADVERGYLSTTIWGSFALILSLVASWPEPSEIGESSWKHKQ